MRKSHFNDEFFSVIGDHNQQFFFACSNEEKRTTKGAFSSPISMVSAVNYRCKKFMTLTIELFKFQTSQDGILVEIFLNSFFVVIDAQLK